MTELQNIISQFTSSVGSNLLQLLAALGILILGWPISLTISPGIRAALKRIGVNEQFVKITEGGKQQQSIVY